MDAYTRPETGLGESHVGDPRLKFISFVYDDAQKTNANLLLKKMKLVRNSFKYFSTRQGIWKYGGIINGVDASDKALAGKGFEWLVHVGPNVFWGMVASLAYMDTGQKSFLEFAESRGDWDRTSTGFNRK